MLAGSQIATAERLEVLALATTQRYPDGRPLRETLAALAADGVSAVIPWGFGKWWMGRGRLLADLVSRSEPRSFLLGDSGGRPMAAPRPKLFGEAERRGYLVLPGTDSFPYPSQQRKAGSFGFVLDSWRADDRPATEFRSQLARLRRSPVQLRVARQSTRVRVVTGCDERPNSLAENRMRQQPRVLVIAPQPFFTPRGTPFSVYYRTLVMMESGAAIDLLTYGEGQDVSIPGVRIVRIPKVPGTDPGSSRPFLQEDGARRVHGHLDHRSVDQASLRQSCMRTRSRFSGAAP